MHHETHYKEGKKVSFKKYEYKLAGLMFYPKDFDENKKYPAIVVAHPGGGVKEQCSSLYAWNLAQNGYIVLAYDSCYQGESEGTPRYLDVPESRMTDIKAAVDYFTTLKYVDENKIGALGICAGGGYTMGAVQTEVRIKAAAGISTWNVGKTSREGFPGEQGEYNLQDMLKKVAEARTKEARTGEPVYATYIPHTKDQITEKTSTILKEAYEYYRTERCSYPTSVNKLLFISFAELAGWDAFAYIETVSPRALLFIVGEEAETKYFSEEAFAKAKEPKEFFAIKGASHIDLYDKPEYVDQVVKKLVEFFDKYIKN